jgi:hypothetical protein
MIKRSVLATALAFAAATAVGCGGSTPSDVTSDTDGGTTPATDSGTTPSTDSGTTPATDSGTPPTVDAGAPACTTKTYANFGQAFFASKCNGCHAIQSPRLNTQTGIRNNLAVCKSEISRGSMPQGTRLTTQEKTDVLEWLNCGAP